MKLSDVANRINGNVDRFTTDLQYYVGGEHFDSNELAITRKGNLKESLNILGFKFHFAFQERDVIFMARNPHLRKAGMVMFSGLCSDASYIVRTKDENVLSQDYLACLLQTDHFWDYCESHKVGSVNFAINYTTFANFEFDLPPIEKQREIAAKVWAAYKVKESYRQLLSTTDEMLKAKFQKMFGEVTWEEKKISDIIVSNFSGEWGEDDTDGTGTKVIKTNNFNNDGSIDFEEIITRNIPSERVERKRLQRGDILLERSGGTKDNPVGRVVYFDNDGIYVTNNFVQTLRCDSSVNSKYIFYNLYFYYNINKVEIRRLGHQTSGIQNLDFHRFMDRMIAVPPIDEQERFADIATQAEATKASLRESIASIDRVIRSLINQ